MRRRSPELALRHPAHALVLAQTFDGEGADAMVMTMQGYGTSGRALFGNAADRVRRRADTPTVLVRDSAIQVAPRTVRIVAPSNAMRAEGVAVPMARNRGGLERGLVDSAAGNAVREAAAPVLLVRAKPEERAA